MRDVNDLTEMVIRHAPRRSRRSLFSEEEAQQYLLGDGGPLMDQSIGMDDLDPAFPDYNVANLFNAYFRDGDPEDDTLDYWEIENGDTDITVEQCGASPGGICLHYAPTGAVSISSKLISAAVPVGPGLDVGVVVAVGNRTSGSIFIKAKIRWYDEEERRTATTGGRKKKVKRKVLRWLKIPRSKAAQSASFCSLVLEFSATGSGIITIFGAGLYPLTPSFGPSDDGDSSATPPETQGLFLYDNFNRGDGSLGEILTEAENDAPWEGGTTWRTRNDITETPDDGPFVIESNAAHVESPAGSEFRSSWQKGTTWQLGIGDGPEVVSTAEGLTITDGFEGWQGYDLHLPDGCDVPGRHLIAWIGTVPYNDLLLTMVTHAGWTRLDATVGSTWFWKRLGGVDGTDPTGYPEEDAVEAISIFEQAPGSVQPIPAATVILVEALYDEGSANPGPEIYSAEAVNDADPPAVGDPNLEDPKDQLTLIGIRAELPVTRDTDDLFAESGTDNEAHVGENEFLSMRADWKVSAQQAEDPDAYTVTDMTGPSDASWTIILRGGVYADPDAGYVPDEELPDGPHSQPHIALIKFRVTDSDNGAYFTYEWHGAVEEGVDIGGGGKIAYIAGGTFINLLGQSGQALGFDLQEGNWYWMRLDFTGEEQRMKVWANGDKMPANWDQSFALADGNDGFAYIVLFAEIVAGTGFDIDEVWIGLSAEAGTSGRVFLGVANGATTVFTSPLHWGAGGPKVYVDGYLTALVGYSSADWSFTFDRAPSFGAKIEVEV
jgi:hypothetical protein